MNEEFVKGLHVTNFVHLPNVKNSDKLKLILNFLISGLKAIEGAAGDKDLDEFNTGVCYVGEDCKLKMCTPEEVRAYLDAAGIGAGSSAPSSPVAASGKTNDDDDVVMEEA